VLPACPTANEWNAGVGDSSAKVSLAENFEKTTTFSSRIGDYLPGEARKVARQMLGDSVRFLQKLSDWMSTHYHEVFSRSGASDKECWGLISHCVRTVLRYSVLQVTR
jgi:hypothetical protein